MQPARAAKVPHSSHEGGAPRLVEAPPSLPGLSIRPVGDGGADARAAGYWLPTTALVPVMYEFGVSSDFWLSKAA